MAFLWININNKVLRLVFICDKGMIDHIIVRIQKLNLNISILICLRRITYYMRLVDKGCRYLCGPKYTFCDISSKMSSNDCASHSSSQIRSVIFDGNQSRFLKVSEINSFWGVIDSIVRDRNLESSWIVIRNILNIWYLKQNCRAVKIQKVFCINLSNACPFIFKFNAWAV